jgi:hypothetical protein
MGNTLTEEEWNIRDLAFEKALRKLREEYPEFYIEVWGPYDFVCGVNRAEFLSHDLIMAEIIEREDEWPEVVNELHEGFDANYGTNWNRLEITVKELRVYKQVKKEIRRDAK